MSQNESAPEANRGAQGDVYGSKKKKTKRGQNVAPARRKRKKLQLSPIHGRMLRRRGELVRLARARQDDDVDLDSWLRAACDVLVFSKHGCDHDTFFQLADKMGLAVDEDAAMAAIHATERIRSQKLYHSMRDDTVGHLLRLTTDERARLSIRTIAAFDETPEQASERIRTSASRRQARWRANMTPQERERQQALDRERRWAKGVTPRSLSLSQRRPWEKHIPQISRRTWYRRYGPSGTETSSGTKDRLWHKVDVDAQSILMCPSTAALCHPAVPQSYSVEGHTEDVPPPAMVQFVPASPGCSDPVIDLDVSPSPQAPPPADQAQASPLSVTGQSVSADWDVSDWVDRWNERSAILEYDAGCTRQDAEFRALDEIILSLQEHRRALLDEIINAVGWNRHDADYWMKFYSRKQAA